MNYKTPYPNQMHANTEPQYTQKTTTKISLNKHIKMEVAYMHSLICMCNKTATFLPVQFMQC